MIPKLIHYCWFGKNIMPDDEIGYIEGWKRKLKGYEFKLWNENNFDIHSIFFTAQAAKFKKWSFVADYVRAYAVYHYGGIYLDTDVEVIKPFDDILESNICIGGFEDEEYVNPGSIFAGEKNCTMAKELMDSYSKFQFLTMKKLVNTMVVPRIFTRILLNHGLKQNNTYQDIGCITVFPTEYFSPMSYRTGILNVTDNTYSIHHYKGSWVSYENKKKTEERWNIFSKYGDTELSNKLIKLMDNDIHSIPLYKVYKIAIKRTLKRLFGKRLVCLIKKILIKQCCTL